MTLKNSMTYQILANSFAGEVQSGARYQFAADKALKEGYSALSDLLKVHAKNEMAHAKLWFDTLTNCESECINNIDLKGGFPFKCGALFDQIGFEADNEKVESDLYQKHALVAEDEGFSDIAQKMRLVSAVELQHHQELQQIAKLGKAGKIYKMDTPYLWKCSTCGHEASIKNAWTVCPLCGGAQGFVELPLA